jgi:predicted transcriptional regulator
MVGGSKIVFSFHPCIVYILNTMTGEELKAARLALQLTQKGLAEALDLAKNHVARMERGELAIRRVTEFAVMHLLIMSKQKGKKPKR